MNAEYILPLAEHGASLEEVGGKGKSLAQMAAAGLPVPGGFHLTTRAYRKFVEDNGLQPQILAATASLEGASPEKLEAASGCIKRMFLEAPIPMEIAEAIRKAYQALPGEQPAVAVRSSATTEDLPQASFAGQQDSYLNIRGPQALCDAIRRCWASLWTARAISYRMQQGFPGEGVALAVIVQRMVFAEAAGILFTANPLNGRRSEMVVNASWGLGEAIVGGNVTPDTLTAARPSGAVLERQIARKEVQVSASNGGTVQVPVPAELQEAAVLSDRQAAALVSIGNEIETLFGMPMDIEWTLAGGEFAVVQARPITALPHPEPPIPTEWKLPKGAYAAMRNNIVELMTDPLTPLFKTFGLQAVNTSLDRIMTGFLGDTGVLPSDPIIAINEYAYYNGSVKFLPMFKIILDSGGIMRRMFGGAVERWTESGRPKYLETVRGWQEQPWRTHPAAQILEACRDLAEAAIDAYGALVSGVIPAAWMTEAWFTFRYRFVRRKDDPPAPVFLMGFDSLPIRSEKDLFDLANWAREQKELAGFLSRTRSGEIAGLLGSSRPPEQLEPGIWEAWSDRFTAYLQKYGHMIYNLDFGYPLPADDPQPMLETFLLFLRGEGIDPYERQRRTSERREEAVRRLTGRLKGRRLRAFQKNIARAQKFAPLREDGLADVGLSYPLLRQMLRELGERLVRDGAIAGRDEVFWLTGDELAASAARLDGGQGLDDLSGLVLERKAVWRAARKANPPMALPQLKVFGRDLLELRATGFRKKPEDILKGVAASPGSVTAAASVLGGPQDFGKMKLGNVLVASLTTPAWTPLFARASAIVTDIGGPLSHGSIVAREYGIPAVLGTGGATSRIRDGQVITVDGEKGEVILAPATAHPQRP